MEFWFRRKYNLAPLDPRFLELTPEEIWTDFYAHHFHDHPNASGEEFEDVDFNLDEVMAKMEGNDWMEV